MGFIKQKKETKRKVSILMALAMCVSLLPISPSADAAASVKVSLASSLNDYKLENDTVTLTETSSNSTLGTANITLVANGEGKEIYQTGTISVVANSVITDSGVTSGSAIESASPSESPSTEPTGTPESSAEPTGTPESSAEPTGTPESSTEPTGTPESSTEPTGTPESSTEPTGTPESSTEPTGTPESSTEPTGTPESSTEPTGTPESSTEPTGTPESSTEPTGTPESSTEPTGTPESSTEPTGTPESSTEPTESPSTEASANSLRRAPSSNEVSVSDCKINNGKLNFTVQANIDVKNIEITQISGVAVRLIPPQNEGIVDNDVQNEISSIGASQNEATVNAIKEILKDSTLVLSANSRYTEAEVKEMIQAGTVDIKAVPAVAKGQVTPEEKSVITNYNGSLSAGGESWTPSELNEIIDSDDSFALNITLTSQISTNGAIIATSQLTNLGNNTIRITMSIPKSILNKQLDTGFDRLYFILKIHDGTIEILPCDTDGTNIAFNTGQFSTYVLFYKDVKKTSNSGISGGGSSTNYASAAPTSSAKPSTSTAPNTSTAPSASTAPNTSTTPNTSSAPDVSTAPNASTAPSASNAPNTSTTVKVGKKVTVSNLTYKVTSVSGTRIVQFTGAKKNAKTIVIPATIKINGKSYKVTTIANGALKGNRKLTKITIGKNINKIGKNAFQGCKNLKNIIIKTKKLTAKKVGTGAFKNIKKNAKFKVPNGKVKAYKKIVKAKGAGKNVKVQK